MSYTLVDEVDALCDPQSKSELSHMLSNVANPSSSGQQETRFSLGALQLQFLETRRQLLYLCAKFIRTHQIVSPSGEAEASQMPKFPQQFEPTRKLSSTVRLPTTLLYNLHSRVMYSTFCLHTSKGRLPCATRKSSSTRRLTVWEEDSPTVPLFQVPTQITACNHIES